MKKMQLSLILLEEKLLMKKTYKCFEKKNNTGAGLDVIDGEWLNDNKDLNLYCKIF